MIGILNTGGEYSEFYAVNPETTSHTIFTVRLCYLNIPYTVL